MPANLGSCIVSSTSCLAADHCSNETAHVAPQSPKSEHRVNSHPLTSGLYHQALRTATVGHHAGVLVLL